MLSLQTKGIEVLSIVLMIKELSLLELEEAVQSKLFTNIKIFRIPI